MAAHGSHSHQTPATLDEKVRLGHALSGIKFGALLVGVIAAVIAVVFGFFITGDDATKAHARFYHGWLTGLAWCLSIALAGLFFTMMQHMVKVGWSVNIRRVPEALAASLPVLGLLALPLLIPVIGKRGGELYSWAVPHHPEAAEHASAGPMPSHLPEQFASAAGNDQATAEAINAHATAEGKPVDTGAVGEPETHENLTGNTNDSVEHGGNEPPGLHTRAEFKAVDELTEAKATWLNPTFFTVRIVAYFTIWTLLAWYFYSRSKAQDVTGDAAISVRLAVLAAPCMVVFALSLTFGAFDLIMSLDHHWFSTIFGVYYYAGGMVGMFAATILVFRLLQARGFVERSVTTEHYHDLGKYLFAFVFFWGYIGFGQFMLQWYAALPEEVAWWARRGVTMATLPINTISQHSGFSPLSYVLLFGGFILPFAYLLSRHIKRSKEALIAGAIWMLVMHLVDSAWLVLPEYNDGEWTMGLAVIGGIVAVIALFAFGFFQILGGANLRPIRDPRATESLAFVNM